MKPRSACPSSPIRPRSSRAAGCLVTLLALGCGGSATPPRVEPAAPAHDRPAPAGGFVFANRVWVVEASNAVAVGSVYVFLGDRTLVLAGPGSTPAFGRWEFERGELAVVEGGVSYPADIAEAKGDRLRLRLRGPGEPVTLDLRDARPAWIDEPAGR
jgi:hypothetical protein